MRYLVGLFLVLSMSFAAACGPDGGGGDNCDAFCNKLTECGVAGEACLDSCKRDACRGL
jgi:hypothetical protein